MPHACGNKLGMGRFCNGHPETALVHVFTIFFAFSFKIVFFFFFTVAKVNFILADFTATDNVTWTPSFHIWDFPASDTPVQGQSTICHSNQKLDFNEEVKYRVKQNTVWNGNKMSLFYIDLLFI